MTNDSEWQRFKHAFNKNIEAELKGAPKRFLCWPGCEKEISLEEYLTTCPHCGEVRGRPAAA